VAAIGKSIVFKGELTGSEDLEVNGTVEGDVKLPDNTLTVGQTGHVKASVSAKSVQIVGKVQGDVTATERIEIEASGVVDGDLRAPRLLVQEGAVMNGTVEMTAAPSAEAGKSASATPASTTAAPRASSATRPAGGSTPTAN
jgi:cytoskeletal protein CcmA (bactofilin family)